MTSKKHQRQPRTVPTARVATACDVRGPLAGGSADVQPASTFECENWPQCGCPDGAVSHDCPAFKRMVATRRFSPIAAQEQSEPVATWLDWLVLGVLGATLAFGAGVAVYVAAMLLGAVIALVF